MLLLKVYTVTIKTFHSMTTDAIKTEAYPRNELLTLKAYGCHRVLRDHDHCRQRNGLCSPRLQKQTISNSLWQENKGTNHKVNALPWSRIVAQPLPCPWATEQQRGWLERRSRWAERLCDIHGVRAERRAGQGEDESRGSCERKNKCWKRRGGQKKRKLLMEQ